MRTMFSALFLAVGIALLILGLNASNSMGSEVSKVFRGTPSDRATLFIVLGAAATVTGLVGVLLTFRSRPRS
jgi:hypothetical protein